MTLDTLAMESDQSALPVRQTSIACVISNFNYQDYVAQAVDSALAQTVAFQQIIVVNDGSTDNSLNVLKSYGERITLLDIPNSGQTGACLRGFAAVETDYVYFLDADDFPDPDFVETLLPLLATSPIKVQFQLRTMRADTGSVYAPFPTYADRYDADAMISDNKVLGFYRSPPTSGNVFKSQFVRSLDLSRLNPRGAIDGTINLLAPYFGEVISLNRPLAFRRVHAASFGQWSKPTPALLQKELDIFERTWLEAIKIMKWDEPPFGRSTPVYVLDRELMKNALSGRFWLLGDVLRFINRMLQSREPAKQRILIAVWAFALLPPIQGLREQAIGARRSPVNRSGGLERLVRLMAGK